jgi:hypothetical protein
MKHVMIMATMNGNQAPVVNFFNVAEISIEGRGDGTCPEDAIDKTEEEEEGERDDKYESPDDVHDSCKKARGDNHDTGDCSSVMRRVRGSDPSFRKHS